MSIRRPPLWAWLVYLYERRLPNHRGKRLVLRGVYTLAKRSGRPFVWRMRNGALVALAPVEGLAPYATVGWTCFLERAWEPHVERCLRELLRPGDVAYDVGANIGYFSAVMAQAVGPDGRVVAFEPAPETFARLEICRDANGFAQLTPIASGLGDEDGMLRLGFDPRFPGDASVHDRSGGEGVLQLEVPIRRLDGLVGDRGLPPPSLLKVDVEGHELAVLRGARQLLAEHRPALVVELNEPMSRRAGWTAGELAAFLQELAPYRFFVLGTGEPRPVEPGEVRLEPGGYIDLLALA